MDEREGLQCAYCRATWRVRQLTQVLLNDIEARTGKGYNTASEMVRDRSVHSLAVAEINKLAGLHKYLSRLPRLSYSEYGRRNSENVMDLSYPDASFDYVLTSDTLEHIPDFDLALSEIRRVLKPGGKHIFTIPIVWNRQTRRRAETVNGATIHNLPPSHHGAANISPEDYLVFNEFGGDVVERIERAGLLVALVKEPENEMVVTIVASKSSD
jgi:SAM-dependent methyltransferase